MAQSVSRDDDLAQEVARARAGDRSALEKLVRAIRQDVYNLAMRFLWHPADAEDATQEALIRMITGLESFKGESSFRTWAYRVACNTLLTAKQKRMQQSLTFAEFSDELAQELPDDPAPGSRGEVEQSLLLEEVKIGCTTAMLLCLDRDHRLAYIVGEILELEDQEATYVLNVSAATFRKRLSRARADILGLMKARCGLVEPSNRCRCRKRVEAAISMRRVDPNELLFATSAAQAQRFPQVLRTIRELEVTRRAAALYRSHPEQAPSSNFASWLAQAIEAHG